MVKLLLLPPPLLLLLPPELLRLRPRVAACVFGVH
jgi:hypothetical protein